jgi:hypothetical protein
MIHREFCSQLGFVDAVFRLLNTLPHLAESRVTTNGGRSLAAARECQLGSAVRVKSRLARYFESLLLFDMKVTTQFERCSIFRVASSTATLPPPQVRARHAVSPHQSPALRQAACRIRLVGDTGMDARKTGQRHSMPFGAARSIYWSAMRHLSRTLSQIRSR